MLSVVVAAVTASVCQPDRPASVDAGVHHAAAPSSARILARLEGREVTTSEFLAFLERSRGPGYRPATPVEATRLIRAYLRALALETRTVAGSAASADPAPDVESLVLERAAAVSVSDDELAAVTSRHAHLRAAEDAAEVREALRQTLERRRAVLRSEAYLDDLLDDLVVSIDLDGVRALARKSPTGPPLPPGYDRRPQP